MTVGAGREPSGLALPLPLSFPQVDVDDDDPCRAERAEHGPDGERHVACGRAPGS
ncbi:hypothetical protein [Streptomyces humidus]|uniref:hypothetical protein n=1 Tax=Streptomyces humidus TaxID=52259 RepID=UPI0033274D84